MLPIFITVTLKGGNNETRTINVNQISSLAKKTDSETGEEYTMINIGIGAIMNVLETPDQIRYMIGSAIKNIALDVVSSLHSRGFIGH